MTRREFLDLLDRYGAEPSRWPAPLRLAADRAMAGDADLRALLAAEQALEAALCELPAAAVSPDLRRAVLDIPLTYLRGSRASPLSGLVAGWRRWAAGIATVTAAGLVGFVLGYGQLVNLPTAAAGEQAATDDLASLLSDNGYDDASDAENAE